MYELKPRWRTLENKIEPQAFWRDPAAFVGIPQKIVDICEPRFYLDLHEVTNLVVDTLSNYTDKDDRILEIGCGTGRNLAGLYKQGYLNLSGIEISQKAVETGLIEFPEYAYLDITNAAVEDVIGGIEQIDVIYTQGCFMHLPPTSEWVFDVVAQKAAKLIMTIENEVWPSERAWARNYAEVFEGLGWQCIKELSCGFVSPLPDVTILRVFVPERELE